MKPREWKTIDDVGFYLMCLRAKYRREGNFAKADEIRKFASTFINFEDLDHYIVYDVKWNIPKEVAEKWDILDPSERNKYCTRTSIIVKPCVGQNYDYDTKIKAIYDESLDKEAFIKEAKLKYENEINEWLG